MSDFTSTLTGLGDAFVALAKHAEEIEQRLARQFAELEAKNAAMRSVLHRIGLNCNVGELHRDINLALSNDAGMGWVSPEQHADKVAMARLLELNAINARIAELYGKTDGMGNAAHVYKEVFELLAKRASEIGA